MPFDVLEPETTSKGYEILEPEGKGYEVIEPERSRAELKAGYAQQKRELEEAARQGKGIENLISLAQIGLKAIAPLDVTGTATREMVRQGEQPLPPVIPPQAFQNDVNTVVGFGSQGLRNLGIPIPTDIQQGISEFGAETLSSMTDPTAGAAMIAGGMAPKIAGPAIGRYFQAKMASEIPAATEAAMQAETPSEQVKAGLGVASLAALPIAIQAHLNRVNAIQIPPGIPSMGRTLEMPRGAPRPRVEPIPIERLTGADLVRMNEQMNREAGIDFEPEKGAANAESIRTSEEQLPQTRIEPQGIQEAGGNVVEQKPPGQPEPVVERGQPQAQSEVLLTSEAKPFPVQSGEARRDPIVAAAIKDKNGVVRSGQLHPLIEGYGEQGSVDGFVTRSGRFVNRYEAENMDQVVTKISVRGDLNASEIQDPIRREAYLVEELKSASPEEAENLQTQLEATRNEISDLGFVRTGDVYIKTPQLTKGQETIVSAASRLGSEIATGTVHFQSEQALRNRLGLRMNDPRVEDIEHGFLTSKGRYVDQEEAATIARKANQLAQEPESGFLGSHDLKQGQSEVGKASKPPPLISEKAPEVPAPSAASGELGTGEVVTAASQPPAISTDKPNLTETQVAPSAVATQATPIRPGPGASTMADVGAESAAQSAGIRTAEFVNEAAKTPDIPVKGPEPVVEADLQSVDPKVEQRWQDAKIAKQTILQKGLAAIGRARDAMTRHFRWLDPKTDGVEIDILRRHENVPVFSKYLASQVLRGVTATLSPRKYDVFSRIVILRDLAKYAEKYGEQLEELPFGYPSLDAIKTDLARFEQTAQKFPDIAQAVQRRDAFMDALRYDLVSRGLLPEQVKDFGEYFHHQVLEHMAMKESGPVASTGAYDVRAHKKGWQRKRTGSEKDYNTSYLESEFEVISQAFSQMLTQDTLKELRGSDILPDLKAEAKAQGADWQSLIPKDYTIWQPQKGNHFYWANSIADKALESYFRGERSLTEKDVKEILAMGGPKEQWVIPKRLAKTLNDWGPQVDHPIEKFIGAGQSQWKRWTLFNPMRNLIYELNNFSGDADIAFAVDPKIFQFAPEAAKVLREFVLKKKAGTQEINELIKLGVIDSGFSVQELPDLKGNQFFKALEGKDPSIVSKYWNTVLDFNRWREGILRYAAYQRALQKLQAGEKPYWTSKRTEMDALYSDPRVTQQQIAAKLAREAIGDYGNISVAGQWIRSKMIPFYAWMEINAPRYVRLFQNLPYEGEGRGRLAGVAAKKVAVGGAKLAARAGALYILANIWNKTFFPQEEKELADTRDQFHIILGRNEDGSVRSLRFQGALSDALSWFGGEDVIGDVEAVKRGTATVGEKLTEAAKSPVNKLLNASFPIQKTLTEALFQKTTFPDVFNPRLVRDPGAHLARLVSMGTIYNYLTSKPQRTGTWSPLSLVTYTTDPGEAAYYTAKSLVSKYLEDQQKERPGSEPTRRGNALYYYKQAVKYKDEKTAEYWKQKYFELGGKPAGMQTSIRNSSPFYGVKRNPFMETLTPSEQAIMLRAEQWYKRTYLNH